MKIYKVNSENMIPKLFEKPAELIVKWKNNIINIYYIKEKDIIIGRIIVDYENRFLNTETIKNKRVCLSYLLIYKEYRRKGYASKLIDYVINDLISKGYSEFTVGVEPKNGPALQLYKSKGFIDLIDHSDKPFPFDLYLRVNEK